MTAVIHFPCSRYAEGMDIAQVSAARMISSGLVGACDDDPAEVVRRLACMQAQALPGALVSVALRTASQSLPAVRAAIEDGRIVRTWTQRGTLHFAAAEDVGGILALTAPRLLKAQADRRAHFGVSEPMLEQAAELAETAISARGPLSRDDLLAEFAPLLEGVAEADAYGRQRYLLTTLSMQGLLVQSGFTADGQEMSYALRDRSADAAIDTEAALRQWLRRYVESHGPVTVDDAARWTGLPKTPVRAALRALTDEGAIVTATIDEREHVQAPDLDDRLGEWEAASGTLMLLPGFDELILGYKDRSQTLAPAHEKSVVPGGNGMFKNTVIDGTRARGTWKRSPRKTGPRVIIEPFTGETVDLARAEAAALTHPAFG